MNGEPFSLADSEALFSPEDLAHIDQEVDAAPEFTPEQRERIRSAFATASVTGPASDADAA